MKKMNPVVIVFTGSRDNEVLPSFPLETKMTIDFQNWCFELSVFFENFPSSYGYSTMVI